MKEEKKMMKKQGKGKEERKGKGKPPQVTATATTTVTTAQYAVAFVCTAVVTALAYSNSLHGKFVFDDLPAIVQVRALAKLRGRSDKGRAYELRVDCVCCVYCLISCSSFILRAPSLASLPFPSSPLCRTRMSTPAAHPGRLPSATTSGASPWTRHMRNTRYSPVTAWR